jgi:hypothetical protein
MIRNNRSILVERNGAPFEKGQVRALADSDNDRVGLDLELASLNGNRALAPIWARLGQPIPYAL